jgi:hypothetical protein
MKMWRAGHDFLEEKKEKKNISDLSEVRQVHVSHKKKKKTKTNIRYNKINFLTIKYS